MHVCTYIHAYICMYLPMVGVKQRKPNVIMLQKPRAQYFVFKLHCVLQTYYKKLQSYYTKLQTVLQIITLNYR